MGIELDAAVQLAHHQVREPGALLSRPVPRQDPVQPGRHVQAQPTAATEVTGPARLTLGTASHTVCLVA